jgi:EAL domain-containing protein (putative c-di-GMP-specific phosphodiesterase class I)/DNA-binding response OmpR family regulator
MRIGDLCQRGKHLCQGDWDINTALLLAEDAEALASTCHLLGNAKAANRLEDLAECLWGLLDPPRLADADALTEIQRHLARLGGAAETPAGASDMQAGEAARLFGYAAAEANGFPLLVRPPADYWQRFSRPAAAPKRPSADKAPDDAQAMPAAPLPAARPVPAPAVAPAPAPAIAPPAPIAVAGKNVAEATPENTHRRACHMSDGNAMAAELDLQLRAQGYELDSPASVEELKELLSRSAPSLLVLDGAFQESIEEIGALVKAARARADQRVLLIALSEQKTDLAARLRAMRAGCDAFIVQPANAEQILGRLRELNAAENADPFRIMIVEDDRSQALFAESILRKNGMQAMAVNEASAVLDKLDEFRPDLILMDLNMPVCDGMELTALIREREAYLSTPIVFLSGEGDTDKHFEALSAGGDDFLTKPIAPRHLITAVTSRVRRARMLERKRKPAIREAAKGVHDSAQLARRLTEMLAMEDAATRDGGLMYIELVHAGSLRDSIGRFDFRQLMDRLTALVGERLGGNDMLARCGDSSFLLLNPDRSVDVLREQAEQLRQAVATTAFGTPQAPRTLGVVVGICPFAVAAGDAKAMIDAAERAQLEAAAPDGTGVVVVEAGIDESAQSAVVEAIRVALDKSSFRVVFQPIVSLHGEEEEQFQALLRLPTVGERVYAASELVPAAEAAGLIVEVDRWMLDCCLGTIATHLRDGRNLRLFVSQSARSVRDPGLVEWMRGALESHRVPASHISLEMRMLDAADALPEHAAFARSMKELGVSLTLSGLEAGAQGTAMLLNLPVDYVKLAPRYTGDADESLRSELRELVKLCHDSGRRVIAPRVEEARVAASLWASGIDLIQGNFVQQATLETNFDFQTSSG